MTKPTVLLTGASGVVGAALAEDLGSDYEVIALVHENVPPACVEHYVKADVRRRRLGLDDPTWSRLAKEVDIVVHSAATTAWDMPVQHYDDINVAGTANVIELSQAAEAPIHFMSSSFAACVDHPEFDRLVGSENVVRNYLTSKRECEDLVASSGLSSSSYRLTNLIGHSETGVTSGVQIVQIVSSWLLRGRAPFYPAHPGNLIDLVPIDVASAAISQHVRAGDFGSLFSINMGANALSVPDALERIVEIAAMRGRALATPLIASPLEDPPVNLEILSDRVRSFLQVLIDVSEVTHASGGTLPSDLQAIEGRSMYELTDDAFRQSLLFWSEE